MSALGAGFPCLRQRWLEGCAGRVDVLLWVPHDGGPELLDALPALRDACAADEPLLVRYLELERDTGSAALAHALGRELAARGLGVLLLEALLPRGLVDPARLPARALRNVFRPDAPTELFSELLALHGQAQAAFSRHVQALDPHGALFIDVHTMHRHDPWGSPASASEAVCEQPGGLAAYVAAYAERPEAPARPIDLVTRSGENRVADARLCAALHEALAGAQYSVAENTPYASAEHLIACHAMRQRRGISLDVPKPLAQGAVERSRLASVLANGVLGALDAARSPQRGAHSHG